MTTRMADLGAGRGTGSWRRLLLLSAALAALLAGSLAITAGGARLATDLLVSMGLPVIAARQIAIATVSTVPPVILAGTLVMTNQNAQVRLVGLAGVAIALTGIAVGLPLGFESAALLVGAIYVTGLFFVLAAVVHGFLDSTSGVPSTPGWTRDSTTGSRGTMGGAMPADGGEDEDDELDFLLEGEDDFDE